MAAPKVSEQFQALMEKVFSANMEKIDNQVDFNDKYQRLFSKEYQAAAKIVTDVKDNALLAALMNIYLDRYGKHIDNKNLVHFYWSDQLFWILISQSIMVPSDKGDLFEQWDTAIKGGRSNDSYNSFRKRFLDLNQTTKSQVISFFKEGREKKRVSKSILDALKDEYTKQKGPLKSIDDLYHFDPAVSVRLKAGFAESLSSVISLWNLQKEMYGKQDFHVLDLYLLYLKLYISKCTGTNPLVLFQLIKYLQDFFITKKEPIKNLNTGEQGIKLTKVDPHELVLYSGVYQLLCVRLMEIGRNVKLYKRNMYGFTPEEVDYFMKPIYNASFLYSSNVHHVISFHIKKNDDLPNLYGVISTFLATYILTQYQLKGISLVDWKKTQEIQNIWNEINDLTTFIRADLDNVQAVVDNPRNLQAIKYFKTVCETKIQINQQGPDLGKATLAAGQRFGSHEKYGDVSIVYMDPNEPTKIYIEFASLKPQLFLTSANYVSNKFYGSKILEVYNNTIGMVYVNQLIFQAMFFLPTFIEFGFAGLIYEIITFYASVKVEEQVSKIDPLLGKVAGLMTLLLAPRPNFKGELKGATMPHLPQVKSAPIKITEIAVKEDLAMIIERQEQLALQKSRGIVDKMKDKAAGSLEKISELKAKGIDSVSKGLDYASEKLGITQAVEAIQGKELAHAGGMEARSLAKPSVKISAPGVGGKATSSRISSIEAKLKNSKPFKKLQEYRDVLFGSQENIINQKVNAILKDLRAGTITYNKARESIDGLINSAREFSGEIAAEQVINFEHKILREIDAPPRGKAGVVMLDKVYFVEHRYTGKRYLILLEVKGGPSTPLGKVNSYRLSFKPKGNKVEITWNFKASKTVDQASGEWYYQRIYEIYEKDPKLAKQLFDAIKNGEFETMVIKSAGPTSPRIRWDTGDIADFFKNKIWLVN